MAEGSNEIAICDIDASFTNNICLPSLPNEALLYRILSIFKN